MRVFTQLYGCLMKYRQLFSHSAAMLLLLISSSFTFSAEREDYDLDDDRYIEINDLADLNEIRNNLDGTSLYGSSVGCPDATCLGFELAADLDFDTNADGVMDENDAYWNEGLGWLPIGTAAAPASLILKGEGFSIKNLFINRLRLADVGLFGYIDNSNIQEMDINGDLTSIRGNNYVGAIAGRSKKGQILQVNIDGAVSANNYAGGLIGAGFDGLSITESSSRGKVSARSYAGGLVGYIQTSNLDNTSTNTISKSYGASDVFAENNYAGGLVGSTSGSVYINYSFSTGDVSARAYAGGIMGRARGASFERADGSTLNLNSRVDSSYSTGVVKATSLVGGLVGDLSRLAYISYSFSSSYVDTENPYNKGGLVGNNSGGTINYSYWAIDASNQPDNAHQRGGTGYPLATLQCATHDNVTIDNSTCLPALNENGEVNEAVLFYRWAIHKYTDSNGNRVPYWNFGTDQQLPGLDLEGTLYRDSDGDGSLDEDDAWPNLAAVKKDSDGDGYPDAWNKGCDLTCQAESGLIIDQLPEISEAWLDEDFDGLPDAWAESCDFDCQANAIANGLVLDTNLNDFDNDGLTSDVDADENGDGIIDQDSDHDGLIEIYTLAELDVVRHNLAGTGYVAEANGEVDNSGCPFQLIDGEYIQACSGYELMNDLDFDTNQDGYINGSDEYYNDRLGWAPIGLSNQPFSAIFEGNNYEIKNLHFVRTNQSNLGLFSVVSNAKIRNLKISSNNHLQGQNYLGTLAGQAVNSEFSNVHVQSSIISNSSYAGGLIGYATANNMIVNCSSLGSVSARSSDAGGLIGRLDHNNKISHSFSKTTLTNSGHNRGGLVGSATTNNVIEASYATGNVAGSRYVGGLVGYLQTGNTIIASYATGNVGGSSERGGLVGRLNQGNTISYSYATGTLSARDNSGGLVGQVQQADNIIENSYWATDSSTLLTSAGSSDENNYIGLTLASLQCATSANETAAANACIYDNANEAVELPVGLALYSNWNLAGENNALGEFEAYWDFGTNQQLPVLVHHQVSRRDSDGDGIFDQVDVYADIPLGDRIDSDNDGAPDFCSTSCMAEGMQADTDIDGDGLLNDVDAYPEINTSDLLDTDLDGIPDECNHHCQQRGLIADNDDDNDTIADENDAFPTQFEIAVDADNDGLADDWTDVCNLECQQASGITLDLYLNDFDNDGLIDGEGFDTDLTADNGLPVLNAVPIESSFSVDNEQGTQLSYALTLSVIDNLNAFDAVDTSLVYEAVIADQTLVIDPAAHEEHQLILSAGRQLITWTAIDDAGNRSDPLQQIVNVYPKVRLLSAYSSSEENSLAQIAIQLTGPSPVYPVRFELQANAEQTTLDNNDLVRSSLIDLSEPLVVYLEDESQQPQNTIAQLRLPIAQDNFEEVAEILSLNLVAVSDEINGSRYFSLITNQLQHTLEVTAEILDDDADGILDVDDAFALDPAASVDSDGDGRPDHWNDGCDITCLNQTNLVLDLDDDNDGVLDVDDLYPLDAAIAFDNDNDGLPDDWSPNCDLSCQSNSGYVLDEYPNDSDNDGLENSLDNDPDADNGKPVMISVPSSVASGVNSEDGLHAVFAIDGAMAQELEASDAIDSSLLFVPHWNGSEITYENGELILPIGRQVIQWFAIDDAGNRSLPMEQIFDVYPQIKMSSLSSITGEGTEAKIQFELTGPSPVYPVNVGIKMHFTDVSASTADIQSPQDDVNFPTKVHYFLIEAGNGNTPNTQAVFNLPIASDGIEEEDETLLINIQSIRNTNSGTNYFSIAENNQQHELTITDQNLAPEVAIEIVQANAVVNKIDIKDGEVIVRALVTDPNGEDSHTYEWTLDQLGLDMEVTRSLTLDPSNWVLGSYELTLAVSDNGNPVMTTELSHNIVVVDEVVEQSPAEGEEGTSSGGSSSGGAITYLFWMLALLAIYQRRLRVR